MLSYTFSTREKALILVLVVILLAVAWYFAVFQGSQASVADLDGQISSTNAEIDLQTTRLQQMQVMQAAIQEHEEKGSESHDVPDYDNVKPLMTELDRIMSATNGYTIEFGGLDRQTNPDYVLRGVSIDFGCNSYEDAESVINNLANGAYLCVIDSMAITDENASRNGSGGIAGTSVSKASAVGDSAWGASVHAVFVEKAVA